MPKLKLTKTVVEALPLTERLQAVYFDTALTGFGVYVGKKSKSYFAQRQIGRKTCRVTIGGHGVFTTEQARGERARTETSKTLRMMTRILAKAPLGRNRLHGS